MRIRKKYIIFISAVFIPVFLILYIAINKYVPLEDQDKYSYIQSKLKQLENGLNMHKAEVGEIKKQIDTIQTSKYETQQNLQLDNKEMIKDSIIKAQIPFQTQKKCPLRNDVLPSTDLQTLKLYESLPFDNPDGGAWKQGWRLEYDEHNWNSHHKLKVFVVPHSHNDPGWLKTFDEYYELETKQILTNMLRHLDENKGMTFIWAEIVYFSKWYEDLNTASRKIVKRLVEKKQLEFVTGGWVMADEANSHWISLLMQLTEGQTWLKTNLNITPASSWSIDPFGQGPTMPFLLKGSNMENLVIQRTHYSIKKRLAQKRELEFRWRQLWDTTGSTDFFTHMMPFYSYDIPHTCGPDPKICCQFDFKRLAGYGISCPWRIAPQIIDESNVAKRAELIIDQWRKKATLYRTRSVLIPLGDDFRYSQSTEWNSQRTNYETLFQYMNNEPNLNIEAKFGTIQEYFDSVRKEKQLSEFPSLSGDFFTYADRDDHYWSGYYTSRPYHKRMDRVLLNYIRSAEMLHSWSVWEKEAGLDQLLTDARRTLSLFQHHDGITGTARDNVVIDYANKMISAIAECKFVMQQAVYKLLTKSSIYQPDYKFTYFDIDDSRMPGPSANRPTIILGEELVTKQIVIHNSLPHYREEVVELFVSKPFIKVTDSDNSVVQCQITPVWSWHRGNFLGAIAPQPSTTKFRLIFSARIPPLGLAVFTIHSALNAKDTVGTSYAKITILTENPFSINIPDYPNQVEFAEPRDITLRMEDGPGASFNSKGLLKSLTVDKNSPNVPVHLEFLKYKERKSGEKSGAYLFLPDGPAIPMSISNPIVLISKGPIESSITTSLPFATQECILRGGALEIHNLIDIGNMDNTEIIMRLSTGINSEDIFYTDLNGLQVVKRKRFNKIPLQANYYPIPTTLFIQNETTRLTLLTAQPLGGSSLTSGQIEIMQDRRLNQDDNRGLMQGVTDNVPTIHIFKIILENRESCDKMHYDHPAGYTTVNVYEELKSLLHPLEKFIYHENDWIGVLPNFGMNHEELESGIEIAALRHLPHITTGTTDKSAIGIVLHRSNFDICTYDVHREGNVNIRKVLGLENDETVYNSFLTLLTKGSVLNADEINICPMDIKAFIINR